MGGGGVRQGLIGWGVRYAGQDALAMYGVDPGAAASAVRQGLGAFSCSAMNSGLREYRCEMFP